MLYYERVSENVSYLHEDMHALLVYIKLGRDSGYRRQSESAFIYGTNSVDSLISLACICACIMPANTHPAPPH